MNRWPKVVLGDVIDFYDAKRIPLSGIERSTRHGEFPYYGASGIIDWIDDYIFEGRYLLIAEDGENLNSRKLPVAFFASGQFWVNNHAHVVRGKPGVLDDVFLQQWFAQADIGGYITGAAQPKLSQASLRRVELQLPSLDTQRKIAAILSAYDELIENNNRRIKILEKMAQRLYHEWFVDYRYPEHHDVRFVNSELGPIPEGWVISTLGDVCSRITDGAHHSPTTTPTGMPMASVKDMTPRSLDISTCRVISPQDYESLVRQDCRPRAGDILVSKDGANFLKHVFPMFDDSVAVLLSSVALLRPSDAVTPTFLSLSLREPSNKARLKTFVSGAAIPRVVLKDFKLHRLALPPRSIQDRLDALCEPMLRQAVTLESLNMTIRAIRDVLLPRLISGKVDVTDLDISTVGSAA